MVQIKLWLAMCVSYLSLVNFCDFPSFHSHFSFADVRRHKPKFWESVHRMFTNGVHNPLQAMVLDRIKYQLGYPEAARDMLLHKSVLTAVDHYTMGTARPLKEYLRLVGLNMTTKEVTYTGWCEEGTPPPGFEQYNHLYPGKANMRFKGN